MRVLADNSALSSVHGCVFVPTMGALHEGHFTLVREAAALRARRAPGAPVVVSIFVNPTQFNDPADLRRYPRTLDADASGCREAGADVVYAPGVGDIYPPGRAIPAPTLPRVATEPGLEDALRPGHFAGVCQVVHRLFDLLRPSVALFGEKDWQQLAVVRAMVADLGLGVRIHGVATVREQDGLAMSSRNRFLTPEQRAPAAALWRALCAASEHSTPGAAESAMARILTDSGLAVEYAVIRDASSLLPAADGRDTHPARALIAARLGTVRLIDNAEWPMHHPVSSGR